MYSAVPSPFRPPFTLSVVTHPWILYPETELQLSLCNQCPSLFSGLRSPVHLDRHPLLPASPAFPCSRFLVAQNLLLSSLSTPASLCRVLLLLTLPLSICPPFAALNVSNVPINPYGCLLLGSIYPLSFPQTNPLPYRPQPAARSQTVPRIVMYQFPVPLSSSGVIHPFPLLCFHFS